MRINFLYRALVNLFMLLMLSLVLTACNSGAGSNSNASTNNAAISATPATHVAITKAFGNIRMYQLTMNNPANIIV